MNGYGPYYMPQMQSPYMQEPTGTATENRPVVTDAEPVQTADADAATKRKLDTVNGVDGARNQIVQPVEHHG